MLVFSERCLFGGMRLDVEVHEDLRYRLAWGDAVLYENDLRTVRGRRQPYRFRSVEQLRYDFEQDVRALGGQLA
ncbi:MAG TPA: hypothetical protein VEB41_11330 [Burkholderiales bacterium]|nr:hypothetical protein [Burkholderiales bacterium]